MMQRDWTLAENKTLVEADITALRASLESTVGTLNGAIASIDDAVETAYDARSYVDAVTTSLALKAPLANPTFTGTVVLPAGSTMGGSTLLTTATAAPTANPTFTGTVALPASTNVTLNGTALSTTLGLLAPLANPTFTGTVALPVASSVTLNGTALSATYAPIANAAHTGTLTASACTAVALPAASAITLNGTAMSTYLPSTPLGTLTFSFPVNQFELNMTFSPAYASSDYTVVWDVSSGWLQVSKKSTTRVVMVGRDWNGANIDFSSGFAMSFAIINAYGVVTHRATRGTFPA